MKKIFLSVVAIAVLSIAGMAQKGAISISAGAELGFPSGDFGTLSKPGFGATVKGMYGLSNTQQITLTTGYLSFGAKELFKDLLGADKLNQSIIPILAGYRHYYKGFYGEPQIGYGIYKSKIKGGDFASSDSQGAFTWAVGAGYVYKTLDVGIRYQSGHSDGTSVGFAGIRVAYNFSLGAAN